MIKDSVNKIERLVIHQPNLFPRLKVLQKIARGNLWVILDDAQYVTREWQNRSRLRLIDSPRQEFWLSVPVHKPNGQRSSINSVSICDLQSSKNKVFTSVYYTYHRSKYWQWIESYLKETLSKNTHNLAELCARSAKVCFDSLGISKQTIYSSKLGVNSKGTTKLVEICKKLGAKIYVSGSGGLSYLKVNEFKAAKIAVEWQSWSPPVLDERLLKIDWRDISFIDLVARCGPNVLKKHLLNGSFVMGKKH